MMKNILTTVKNFCGCENKKEKSSTQISLSKYDQTDCALVPQIQLSDKQFWFWVDSEINQLNKLIKENK